MEQKFIKALEKEKENYITFRGLCNIIHSIFDVEEIEALYKLVQDPKFLYYLQNYPSSSNSERKKVF